MNDDRHAAYSHAFNYITLCTALVHMVTMLKIAYGRLRESQRMSWMRKAEEVGLNISNTSVRMYMRIIASKKWWNGIGQRHFSLR